MKKEGRAFSLLRKTMKYWIRNRQMRRMQSSTKN
jgi:hypothetical protein